MAEETIDPGLLEQTKNQIRKLVGEIAELAESDIQPPEFNVEFLNRVVAAVAASGGALWMLDQRNTLKLVHQLEFRQTGLLDNRQRAQPHEALLGVMLQANSPQLIPPGAAVEGMPNAGNPTAFTLILAPVLVDKHVVGLVEILMDPNRRAANQKSTLRFVGDLCDLASQYLKNRQVRQMMSQQKLWNQLEGYTHAIHKSLDLKETCYAVANDGKRLAGCDRLSVALKLAAKTRVEAVSGQEVVEQRANLIRELTRLCKVVLQSGEDLVYTGNTEGFPPDIRDALEIYVDESGSKAVIVTILHKPEDEDPDDKRPAKTAEKVPFGCLVAEQIGDEMAPTDLHARCEVLSRHASTALWNAAEHDKIALRPVLKVMSSPRRYLRGRTLAKILAVVGVLVGVVLALAFVPWKLTIEGRGSMLPEERHNTYAPFNGVVVDVPHEHADLVKKGDLLAKLESDEINSRQKELMAQRAEATQKIASLEYEWRHLEGSQSDERRKIEAQLGEAQIRERSALDQLAIIEDQLKKMEVRAPNDGIITTWEVKRNYLNRPVTEGQELVQVAEVSGEWVHEVNVPDHDMTPILEAKDRLDEMMLPVREAWAKFEEAAGGGLVPANADALAAASAGLAQALDKAEDAGAGDLVDLATPREALAGFDEAVAGLKAGGGEAKALEDARAALGVAFDHVQKLSCYFVSAADPEHRYPGWVDRIASKAELQEQNHVVKVTVGFSKSVLDDYLRRHALPFPRPGAEVRVRINCGDTNLAYAMLRDVVQFWYETVIFRWPFLD
jgi:multidrug efflux pump subunit AcrA (membrane-fusion protein)